MSFSLIIYLIFKKYQWNNMLPRTTSTCDLMLQASGILSWSPFFQRKVHLSGLRSKSHMYTYSYTLLEGDALVKKPWKKLPIEVKFESSPSSGTITKVTTSKYYTRSNFILWRKSAFVEVQAVGVYRRFMVPQSKSANCINFCCWLGSFRMI